MRYVEYFNDWDDLRVFLAVARAGSFTEAARQLGTVQSTVGRRIDRLERKLGSKLFLRRSSGMKLSSSGLTLAEYAMGMQKIAHQIERRLVGSDQSMVGTVRLTITDGLAAYWLAPKINEFQKIYPSLRLEITAAGSFIDLSSGQADIAIRYERPADASIASRKLGLVPFALYASPDYVKSQGAPRSIQDLSRHKIVENTNLQDQYGVRRLVRVVTATFVGSLRELLRHRALSGPQRRGVGAVAAVLQAGGTGTRPSECPLPSGERSVATLPPRYE